MPRQGPQLSRKSARNATHFVRLPPTAADSQQAAARTRRSDGAIDRRVGALATLNRNALELRVRMR